jgi:hypothetical protein
VTDKSDIAGKFKKFKKKSESCSVFLNLLINAQDGHSELI